MEAAGFHCLQKATTEGSWDYDWVVLVAYDALGKILAAIKETYPDNSIAVIDRAHEFERMPNELRGAKKHDVRLICFSAADLTTIKWEGGAMFEKGAAEETYKVAVAGLEATSVTPCTLQYSKYKILIRGIAEHTCVEGEGELISDMAEWLGVQVSEFSFRLQSGTMAETFMLMKLVRRRGEEGLRHISMLRNLCALCRIQVNLHALVGLGCYGFTTACSGWSRQRRSTTRATCRSIRSKRRRQRAVAVGTL